ncbi:MAG: hypothetical protein J0H43_00445, partial [Actinobacteria bacterium]|nr:hypothetical protein [Actinomycetota bacterium]
MAANRPNARRAPTQPSPALRALEYTGWIPFACAIVAMMLVAFAGITWINSPYWGNNTTTHAQARNIGDVPTTQAPRQVSDIISPNRIEIPKIHASAPIVDVGTTPEGELE